MKNYPLLMLLFIIAASSCKKEKTVINDKNDALKVLEKAYELRPSAVNPDSATFKFATTQDFANWLQKRQNAMLHSKPQLITIKLKDLNNSKTELSTQSLKDMDFYTIDQNGSFVGLGGTPIHYTAMINSSYWSDLGFPQLANLKWDFDGQNVFNIYSQLFMSGGSYGSFNYYQTLGYGNQKIDAGGTYHVTGIYTEVYGVAGISAYYINYNFTMDAIYSGSSITATLNYVKL